MSTGVSFVSVVGKDGSGNVVSGVDLPHLLYAGSYMEDWTSQDKQTGNPSRIPRLPSSRRFSQHNYCRCNSQSTILDLFSNRRGSVRRKVSSRNPCVKQCLPTRLNSSNTVLDDEIPRNCPEVRGCTLSVITKEHACGNDADQEGHCKDRWIN